LNTVQVFYFMSEWVIIVLLASVTVNGECKNQQVGFAVNEKEIVIVAPPFLDVRLKRKEKMANYTLLVDENNVPYSLTSVHEDGKFAFFINELKEKKIIKRKWMKGYTLSDYEAVKSYMITTADPATHQMEDQLGEITFN
jgi:hypothetical protein